MMYRRNRL